ncbi:MAG TPA: preprotein translocase subunit SecG [Thermoanaerobaculia bacterium]|nr:preprotein translocase subunit SecG [Thermoanaerobaculia bacterium]
MIYAIYAIHIITCIFLILVVLLQQGKGADLSVFGGGTTQAAFGARGAATVLHKLTVTFFVLFLITTLSIGILQRNLRGASVMRDVETRQVEPLRAPAPLPPGDATEEPGADEGSAVEAPRSLEAEPGAPGDPAAQPEEGAAPPPGD